MVSNASDDLPEPDSPVNTTSLSRGSSTSTFLRLCSRAPRTEITRESGRLVFLLWSKRSFMTGDQVPDAGEFVSRNVVRTAALCQCAERAAHRNSRTAAVPRAAADSTRGLP